jgi:pyrimidine operon attenuation protein / uracil phosphoribosyltransferase
MQDNRIIIANDHFQLIIERLCHQLIENYDDFQSTAILGIQPRGVLLAERINARLKVIVQNPKYDFGKLDITFYRDDFRRRDKPLIPDVNEMNFDVDSKKVILIDDVLYTGRSIHAAIAALQNFGRPSSIELLVLVDRRFNRHFPIQADYKGIEVDSIDEEYVKVCWSEDQLNDSILLLPSKSN